MIYVQQLVFLGQENATILSFWRILFMYDGGFMTASGPLSLKWAHVMKCGLGPCDIVTFLHCALIQVHHNHLDMELGGFPCVHGV